MGISKKLTGSPWHTEFLHMAEGDKPRDKRRCIYHQKDNHCTVRSSTCIGSSHCTKYEELPAAPVPLGQVQPKPQPKRPLEFSGVQNIRIADIEIDTAKFKKPSDKKIKQMIENFKKTGMMDKPIVVSCGKTKYKLEDKYLRYYVAKKLGLVEIPAKIGTLQSSAAEDKLKKKGACITHKIFGKGTVQEIEGDVITVQFQSGECKKLSVESCIKSGKIK